MALLRLGEFLLILILIGVFAAVYIKLFRKARQKPVIKVRKKK